MATESHRGYEGRRVPDILCVSLFLCGSLWAKFKNDHLLYFRLITDVGEFANINFPLPGLKIHKNNFQGIVFCLIKP